MAGNHQRWTGRGLDKTFVIVLSLMGEPSRLHIISFVIFFSQLASGVLAGYATHTGGVSGPAYCHSVVPFSFYGGMDDDET